ncbi:MAG: CvpA family protein [bacterium]|nr:CvpA family protein [bacterium]
MATSATQEPRSLNDLLTIPQQPIPQQAVPQQPAPVDSSDPAAIGDATTGTAGHELLQQLQALGWVDTTAVVVLLVFFVVGLFKGLFWQVSRIAILVLAYLVAGRFGGDVGSWLARDLQRDTGSPDTMLYLAYVLVFLGVVVILSLLAMQFQKVLKQTGLTFFDRLGGGLFGVATGACTVLFLLFLVNMFCRETALGNEVEASHSQRLSRRAIDWLGPRVPDELRGALYLAPLSARGPDPHGPTPSKSTPSKPTPSKPRMGSPNSPSGSDGVPSTLTPPGGSPAGSAPRKVEAPHEQGNGRRR